MSRLLNLNVFATLLLLLFVLMNVSHALETQTQNDELEPNKEKRKSKSGTIVIPISSYQDETSLMVGSVIIHYFKLHSDAKKLSSLNAFGMYTFEEQMMFLLSTALNYNSSSFEFSFFHRNYPSRFYGIGNNVDDHYEKYVPFGFGTTVGYFYNLTDKFAIGAKHIIETSELLEVEEGGLLDIGNIAGTEENFVTGLGLHAKWDTRKKQFFPTDSIYSQISLEFHDDAIGSDYDFSKYTFDFRQYIGLSEKQVFAYQLYASFSTGNVPFHMLSNYNLRGFYTGKFIDRNIVYARVEYRIVPIIGRFGAVAFASIGEISNRVSELSIKNLKYSLGFGLRFILDKAHKINFRLDFALGDKFSVYFAAMEIF